jgi:hypothetical protein
VDRITRLTTYAIEVPIRRELMITSSLGTHAVSRPVLVRLETDSGSGTTHGPWLR